MEDISTSTPKKDYFMRFIYLLLIVLVILFNVIYFFGYEFFKPYIEV